MGDVVVLAETNTDVLLHLSALVVAVTIAYIGLDRVRWEPDIFKDRLDAAASKAWDLINRFEVERGKTPSRDCKFYTFPFLIRMKFYVLCHVAKATIRMGASRVFHIFHRQRYVPMLGYFRRRADHRYGTVLVIIALALFLYGTANATFKLRWVSEEAWASCFFAGSAAILLWVIVTVWASHILQNIETRCDRLNTSVENYNRQYVREEVDRSTQMDT